MLGSFGRFPDPFMAIEDGERDGKRRRGRDRDNTDRQMVDPFQGIFHSMNSMMSNMHKNMSDLHSRADSDPNMHSFSSSSVMTYSNDGKSEPKYYQASTSTRRAPGHIRETRRTLKDSESGVEKMAVGHHIGEKGRVIERRRNVRHGGAIEEEKNFYHIGEDDEHEFDREWRDRTGKFNHDRSKRVADSAAGRRGLAAPEPTKEYKKRVAKTPAVAHRGADQPRPHGPSKSGRARSKY